MVSLLRFLPLRDRRRVGVLLAGGAILVAACTARPAPPRAGPSATLGGSAGPPAAARGLVDRPVASRGCGHRPAVRPGTTGLVRVAVPPAAAAGVRQRTFWLHVPLHYRPAHLVPLVLAFHGGGGTGLGMQTSSRLSGLADRDGFLVTYPQGLAQPPGHGTTGWDASGPRDPYAHGIDDGLFVSDLLNAIQAGYCVDPRRIAATGLSNGGSMTGYLACVLAGRIASFVPVEGVFFQLTTGCHPAHPAAILDVHVLTDPLAPYAGVPSRGSPDYYALAIPAWLYAWALRDGCRAGPAVNAPSPQVSVLRWTGCPGGATVAGYRLASGGHSWFRALGALAGDKLILRFLAAHPLTGPVFHWSPRQAAPAPALTAPRIGVASLRQFDVPTAGAQPFDITAGPDGSMWFTEFHADKIGRISPSGKITEYTVPTPASEPYQIAAGPDRSVWFTEYNSAKIGRLTVSGHLTQFTLPRPSLGGAGIIGGPGPAVWVSDPVGYADRVTVAGRITRMRLPASGIPFAMAATRGGQIFVSELTGYFEYSRVLLSVHPGSPVLPALTLPGHLHNIDALAPGPPGAVWFTDFGTGQIGELFPSGRFRLFPSQAPYAGLSDITRGPDHAMWFTEQAGLVGRITPDGAVSQLSLPVPGSNPDGIAAGPGRTIWVTESGTGKIARITLPTERRHRT